MTFLRILLTPVFLIFLFSSDILLKQLSLLVFTLASLTDWYDGWLARRWGYVTRWGAFFDPFADKVLTSAAFLAYAYLELIPMWMAWTIVIRDALITILRSFAEYKGKPIDTSKLAKTKTFTQYVAIFYLLILVIAQNTPLINDEFSSVIRIFSDQVLIFSMMTIITTITIWTAIIYTIDNRIILRELFLHLSKTPKRIGNSVVNEPSFFVKLIASGFFTGYAPIASGTIGSFIALAIYFFLSYESQILLIVTTLIVFLLGIKTAGEMEKSYGHDPAEVTIDEIVGMWVSLFFLPKSILIGLFAFFLFRFFDIVKPYPARIFDNMRGGFGIMMDDVVAGIYTNIIIQIALFIPYIKTFLLKF